MPFYFQARVARPAATGWILLKSLLQTIVFWLAFLYFLPVGIYSLENETPLTHWRFDSTVWVAVLLFCLGGTLGLTSTVIMAIRGRGTPLPADCPRVLVIAGPYRYIRNPMAVAGLTQGIAVGILLGSPAVIAYAFIGGPIWHYFVRPWEERDLERRFKDAYCHYRNAVRCWIPRIRGYQSPD